MSTEANATWRALLAQAMHEEGDAGPVVAYAPNEDAFDVEFYDGYGSAAGPDVLAWTERRVYFPVVYDGAAEWMGSAPRDPQAEGQSHVGGQ
jgi:hypothetical protein